jgi:hypothetical protein
MKWGEGDFSVRGFFRVMRWYIPISIPTILLMTFLAPAPADMTFGNRLSFAVGLAVLIGPLCWINFMRPGGERLYIERKTAAGCAMLYMAGITFVGLLIFAIVEG